MFEMGEQRSDSILKTSGLPIPPISIQHHSFLSLDWLPLSIMYLFIRSISPIHNQSPATTPTTACMDTTFLSMSVFSPVALGHLHPIKNKHPPLPTWILSSQAGLSPLPAVTFLILLRLPPHSSLHSVSTTCCCPSIPTSSNALFTGSGLNGHSDSSSPYSGSDNPCWAAATLSPYVLLPAHAPTSCASS